MSDNDDWMTNEHGKIPAAMLLGFGTASAPDGSLAILQLGYRDDPNDQTEKKLKLAMLPEHIRGLIDTLTKLEARLAAKAKSR